MAGSRTAFNRYAGPSDPSGELLGPAVTAHDVAGESQPDRRVPIEQSLLDDLRRIYPALDARVRAYWLFSEISDGCDSLRPHFATLQKMLDENHDIFYPWTDLRSRLEKLTSSLPQVPDGLRDDLESSYRRAWAELVRATVDVGASAREIAGADLKGIFVRAYQAADDVLRSSDAIVAECRTLIELDMNAIRTCLTSISDRLDRQRRRSPTRIANAARTSPTARPSGTMNRVLDVSGPAAAYDNRRP